MRSQLRRLLELPELPNVTVQVLPYATGAHQGVSGAFILLDVGRHEDLRVVAVDSLTEMSYREKEHQLRSYAEAFDQLRDTALPEADSRAQIQELLSDS